MMQACDIKIKAGISKKSYFEMNKGIFFYINALVAMKVNKYLYLEFEITSVGSIPRIRIYLRSIIFLFLG